MQCCSCGKEATGLDWQKKPWCRPCWDASMRAVHRLVSSYLSSHPAQPPARTAGRFGPEEDQHLRAQAPVDRRRDDDLHAARGAPTCNGGMRFDPRMAQGRARSLAAARAKKAP